MARRWVVLTADRATGRGTGDANDIIEYTEYAGRVAAADEIIYSDPVDASGDPVDGNWRVGGTVTLAGTVYTYTDPPGQIVLDDLGTEVGRLRAAIRNVHQQLFAWAEALAIEGVGHPSADVALGHDYLAQGHHGVYLVVNNHRTAGNADWTAAQRITFCEQMALGASNVTDPHSFFMALHNGANLVGTPILPVVWVDPSTGVRKPLADIITNTATYSLDVTQLPNSSIINGLWINEVTV